jgi:hypothetical protein
MTTAKQALAAHRAAWAVRSAKLKSTDRTQNEGGEGYSSFEVESEKNFAVELPLIQAAFVEEWTADVLAARGAAWNAGVAKCKSNGQEAALAKALGYSLSDLKKAKAMLAAAQ